ncbi:MAG: metallophosphatase family protein [Planctomycetes bacterium]|nr:metallophosphatase family protein [Planctomycetota bacterium]
MKYGVIGDIHSNLEALTVVLDVLRREGCDKILCVGDIVGYGANPKECLDLIREVCHDVVAGNHDYAVCGKMSDNYFNAYARDAVIWTREQLDEDSIDYLASLPLTLQVDENVTIVHGALTYPDMFDYVQTCHDAKQCMDLQKTKVAFFGHSHVPVAFFDGPSTAYSLSYDLDLNGFSKCLVNTGSVGQPRDEVPDSCFVIYDSETDVVKIRRVEYDIDTCTQKIIAAGLPDILAERLRYGR